MENNLHTLTKILLISAIYFNTKSDTFVTNHTLYYDTHPIPDILCCYKACNNCNISDKDRFI